MRSPLTEKSTCREWLATARAHPQRLLTSALTGFLTTVAALLYGRDAEAATMVGAISVIVAAVVGVSLKVAKERRRLKELDHALGIAWVDLVISLQPAVAPHVPAAVLVHGARSTPIHAVRSQVARSGPASPTERKMGAEVHCRATAVLHHPLVPCRKRYALAAQKALEELEQALVGQQLTAQDLLDCTLRVPVRVFD